MIGQILIINKSNRYFTLILLILRIKKKSTVMIIWFPTKSISGYSWVIYPWSPNKLNFF